MEALVGIPALVALLGAASVVAVKAGICVSNRTCYQRRKDRDSNDDRIDGEVSGLFVYPIKSCAGTALKVATLSETGILFDRTFMLTRRQEHGKLEMVSQRQFPLMSQVHPEVDCKGTKLLGLRLTFSGQAAGPAKQPLYIDVSTAGENPDAERREEVIVWPTDVARENAQNALLLGDKVSEWFGDALQSNDKLELVYMDALCRRGLAQKYCDRIAKGEEFDLSFADASPFLLTSEQSLEDVQRRIGSTGHAYQMDRFRPNIVVTNTTGPFIEDTWARFSFIPEDSTAQDKNLVTLFGVHRCTRCEIPSVNQVRLSAERAVVLWLQSSFIAFTVKYRCLPNL